MDTFAKENPAANGASKSSFDKNYNSPQAGKTQGNNSFIETPTTYTKTNHGFMAGIFGELPKGQRAMLVSLSGNPHTARPNDWRSMIWNPDLLDLSLGHNNYFSLSSYYPNDQGELSRKKAQFSACYAFMLDDLGTKIPMDRLTLEPSWLIETSEGNHQAGYILETPLTDPKHADRILKAIIGAGLCDAGAGGATTRLARLPFGINGKSAPGFQCKLKKWNPDLRYGVDDLIHKLELHMDDQPKKGNPGNTNRPQVHDDIFIERPTENPVLFALKARGLYKSPLDGIKHDIRCPWLHEHTGQVDSGTVYYEQNDFYPIGGFKCHHGHCADRHIRDLLSTLNIEPIAARMKDTIRVIAGEIPRISESAELALSKQKRYYQRGGLIVTISNDENIKDVSIKALSPPALLSALCSSATWERYDSRSKVLEIIDPPQKIVGVVFDATDYKHLAHLNGLCHQPYLRPDGTFATQAEYDSNSGMYGTFDAKRFNIPDNPTREDAETALEEIKGLLSEFSFANPTDKAAALSAILTASVRASLPFAPMFHVKAPQIGSGKSFLCQLITVFATPRRSAPTSFPQDDEECRKLLLAELLRAPAVIEFDNMTTDLIPHKSLCTALTSEFITGRILGVSKTTTVGTQTLFLSSGNNVTPVADMTRRCLTITLDTKCETPAAKVYKNKNLIQDVLKDREKYVSLALTIIRAWIVAGRPKTECRAIVTYEGWSDYCRQPLLWLGLPDCTKTMFEIMDDDPDKETLGRLLHAWKNCFGFAPKMVREVVYKSNDDPDLYEVLGDIAGDQKGCINRKTLGRWITRTVGRRVGGLLFVKASGKRSAVAYKIETAEKEVL